LRKARRKRRLSLVALLKMESLPRITVQEYKLAANRMIRTPMAIPPILLNISDSALEPEAAGAATPLSA
jgi:hypothetical protein